MSSAKTSQPSSTKKRRTFFSVSHLPKIPIVSSPSPPPRVSSDQVLLPLLDPDQRAAFYKKQKSRDRQVARLSVDRKLASASATPVPDPGLSRRQHEPNTTDTSASVDPSDDMALPPRSRHPPRSAIPPRAASVRKYVARRPASNKSHGNSVAIKETPRTSTLATKPHAPQSSGSSPRKSGRATARALKLGIENATETKPLEPVTPMHQHTQVSEADAQNSNEKLALAMMQSMRATVEGRKPYERIPVWNSPSDPAASKRRKIPVAKKPSTIKARMNNSRAFQGKREVPLRRPGRPARSARSGSVRAVRQAVKIKIVRSAMTVEESSDGESFESEEGGREQEEVSMDKKSPVKGKEKSRDGSKKRYMAAGFYCQNPNAKSPHKLVSKVLRQGSSSKAGHSGRKPRASTSKKGIQEETVHFPPLPYDYGYDHFFGQEHEFRLPYNIHQEAEKGMLDDRKRPTPYQKLRQNVYPDRARYLADMRAICNCAPESSCKDMNCINRAMSYLCGKDCPCGDACTNKSLAKRTPKETKVVYTGSRGFGLMAAEDIQEGDFVIDYRGEVISLNTFYGRIKDEYKGQKNFYALEYDQGEVIDAGKRGNDARFINHGCRPNLEVRRYQTIGDGLEEYEIGMWALRDIMKGEELMYDYNFDCFGVAKDELRTQCRCGAPNCVGYLGRKPGEKSAKELALDLQAKAAADAGKAMRKGRRVTKASLRKVGRKNARGRIAGVVGKGKRAVLNPVMRANRPITSAAKTSRAHKKPITTVVDHVPELLSTDPASAAQPSSSSTAGLPITPAEGSQGEISIQSGDSPTKKPSGWSDWIFKKAGEKQRTIEEWHEERIKRRRGLSWLTDMITQFGVAPSSGSGPTPEAYSDGTRPAGSLGSFANSLAAVGHSSGPQEIKNLGGPKRAEHSDQVEERNLDSAGAGPSSSISVSYDPVGHTATPTKKRGRGRPRTADGPRKRGRPSKVPSELLDEAGKADYHERRKERAVAEARVKKEAIQARNGAPMGWVYLADGAGVPEKGTRLVSEVVQNLDRSARRSRPSMGSTA